MCLKEFLHSSQCLNDGHGSSDYYFSSSSRLFPRASYHISLLCVGLFWPRPSMWSSSRLYPISTALTYYKRILAVENVPYGQSHVGQQHQIIHHCPLMWRVHACMQHATPHTCEDLYVSKGSMMVSVWAHPSQSGSAQVRSWSGCGSGSCQPEDWAYGSREHWSLLFQAFSSFHAVKSFSMLSWLLTTW